MLRERLMRELLSGVLSREDHARMKQKYMQEGRGLEERLDYLQKEVRREVELLTARNPWLAQFKTPAGKVELTAELVQVLVKQITVYEKPASVRAVSSGNYGSLPGIGRV